MTMQCLEPNCAMTVRSRGLCNKHYLHFKYHGLSFPAGPLKPRPGSTKKFLTGLIGHVGNECIPWPFFIASNGYGQAKLGSAHYVAHRLMCVLEYGEPPTPDSQAAHSCNNRACVNPRHLRWASASENGFEKHAHGTMPRGESHSSAKLTSAMVKVICRSSLSSGNLARQFCVSVAAVKNVRSGRSWSWLTGRRYATQNQLKDL